MKNNKLFKLFLFCLCLIVIRLFKTGHYSFLFLIWNIFLAWLPYYLISNYKHARTNGGRALLVCLTLLFLPNAPYIITDLFHLSKNLVAPMWFDLVLILSCSLLGLILFVLTAQKIFLILNTVVKSRLQFNCLRLLLLLSNGYGIYLGRYLRFNSWDLILHPELLFSKMYHSVIDENNYKETGAVTITFTIFLYLVLEIVESLKERVGEKQNELH